MENKPKYYTPSIEEFHVGFEFEFRHSDSDDNELGWIKYTTPNINQDEENSPFGYRELSNFRVKYLDREDIINSYNLPIIKYIKTYAGCNEDYFEFNDNEHYIDMDYDRYYLRIAMYGDGDATRFSGIIKNKSEFKVLLKQLLIS